MMTVRRFTLYDYEEIIKWWAEQNKAILALEVLPTLGFVCEENGNKLAASWLYCSDSCVGFVGWTTLNLKVSKRKMRDALRMMEECMEGAARTSGMKLVFQFSGGGGFSRFLLKRGWRDSMVKHDFLFKEI